MESLYFLNFYLCKEFLFKFYTTQRKSLQIRLDRN